MTGYDEKWQLEVTSTYNQPHNSLHESISTTVKGSYVLLS